VAPWLADEGDLGVGVHLAAVGEYPPLLSTREIPSLVGGRGHLCETYSAFVGRALLGRIDAEEPVARRAAAAAGFRLATYGDLPPVRPAT